MASTPRTAGEQTDRIAYIDLLKVIGLVGIIIAHTGPPGWMLTLRCFDVPLMVILSSILAERSYSRKAASDPHPVRSYYLSRFQRIVIPTWIFLAIYFPVSYLTGTPAQPFRYYLDSFLLTRYGIDYVWIMLIYLYSALLIPLFCKMGYSRKSVLLVGTVYAVYEIAYRLGIGTQWRIIDSTLYYLIPYGALTWLGCHYHAMSKRVRAAIPLAAGALLLALGAFYWRRHGGFTSPNIFKYPPTLYFLSYGVLWSFGLLWLFDGHTGGLSAHPVIRYISTHSMWIYLWHILILDLYAKTGLPQQWVLKFLVVTLLAVLLVWLVNAGLDLIEKKRRVPVLRYLRG